MTFRHSDGEWVTVETQYNRNYDDGRPKYELDAEAYQRLAADPDVSDPTMATDQQVARYALGQPIINETLIAMVKRTIHIVQQRVQNLLGLPRLQHRSMRQWAWK